MPLSPSRAVLPRALAGSILPLGMLVMISFASFFINVQNLMPRVAVGFVSFLTLSNWAATRAPWELQTMASRSRRAS